VGLQARVQIPVQPSATSRLLYELLGRVRLRLLVVSPLRIACVFLHVERGLSARRVWRSPRVIHYYSEFSVETKLVAQLHLYVRAVPAHVTTYLLASSTLERWVISMSP
jgi:hypothetical protein